MSTLRIWQLDFLRGLAVVGMVSYHAAFLLFYVWGWDLPVITGPWRWLARVSAVTFLVTVGCSLWLKFQTLPTALTWFEQWREYWPRIEKIAMGAVVIILFTLKFTADPVLFGILHHIAISSLILSLVVILLPQKRWWWLALAVIFWGLGAFTKNFSVEFPWLLWLGFPSRHFHSLDYFPLLPWMGWSCVGIWGIRELQADPVWSRWVKAPAPFVMQPVLWLGRNAFWIYLGHIPVLIAFFWLLHLPLVFVR